jgi:hypothetical protein
METEKPNVDLFNDPEFLVAWLNLNIDGWFNWLNGDNYPTPPTEIYVIGEDDDYFQQCLTTFETKYQKKLHYRVEKNLIYLSYIEPNTK